MRTRLQKKFTPARRKSANGGNFCQRCTTRPPESRGMQPFLASYHAQRTARSGAEKEQKETPARKPSASRRDNAPRRCNGAGVSRSFVEKEREGRTNSTNHSQRPPRRAIARQCAGAAQRLAQACRWRDNNGREQNTSTPQTTAPRRRSPVRRGGATARSGASLAR